MEWYGIDIDIETSLGEYGLIVKKSDSIEAWYREDINGLYYNTNIDINNIDELYFSLSEDEKKGFLSFIGLTEGEFLETDIVNKISDLLSYKYTTIDIFGCQYFEGYEMEQVLNVIK